MAIKTYKYNDKTQLSTHYNVQEFKCKCGKNHDIKIDSDLVSVLEKLMVKLVAKVGNISSGYRCSSHDKAVGGAGSGSHVMGYACDICFKDNSGNKIPSKTVCLALEDLGHQCGIGYKSGGSEYSTHIDTRPRKLYMDETKSMSKACCTSYYDYFGIKKATSTATSSNKNLTLTTAVYGRTGGVGFSKPKTLYKKGTIVTNVTLDVGSANGYKWFKGYVNNQLRYFPYKSDWYK
jgi:uncharacterized protein YcbK (DUF882 family)